METGAIGGKPKAPAELVADTQPFEFAGEKAGGDLASITPDVHHGLTADGAAIASSPPNCDRHDDPATKPAENPQKISIVCAADRANARFMYRGLRDYLNEEKMPRPRIPTETTVMAMARKQRATLREMAEGCRTWADGLLDVLNKVDGVNMQSG